MKFQVDLHCLPFLWRTYTNLKNEIVLPATCQAIAPLLDSVGDLRGLRGLDLASGTGHLAKQAVARGATVVGIDAAAAMVELAHRCVPNAAFHEGDAEALPFERR